MYSKENAEKHVSSFLCYFCERVFDNCQALEGHHRAHQWEIRARKSWNNPDLFSKSIAGSSTNANLLPSTQSLSSSGGTNNNMSRVPDRASFLVGFSNNICSKGTTHLNSSKFLRENLGNIGTPSTMSSALSASSAKAEVCPSNRLSYMPYAQSGSHATAALTSVGGKRSYLNDVPCSAVMKMSTSKRLKISLYPFLERETLQAKELPLIMVMEKSLPGPPSSSSAKEEDSADLDISLHL